MTYVECVGCGRSEAQCMCLDFQVWPVRKGWDWHCYECGDSRYGVASEQQAAGELAAHEMVCERRPGLTAADLEDDFW